MDDFTDKHHSPFESNRQLRQRGLDSLNKNHWAAAIAGVAGHLQAREARKQSREEREDLKKAEERDVARQEARYGYAKQLLTPYIERADVSQQQLMVEMGLAPGEAGTAYMQTPGYQTMMKERLGAVEQQQAGMGSAYSGRRMQAAGQAGGAVQSQYYSNYMNLLSSMASPGVAQNLASLGMGQAATMGAQGFQYTQARGEAGRRGSEAQGQYYADIARGVAAYESQQDGGEQQEQETTEWDDDDEDEYV